MTVVWSAARIRAWGQVLTALGADVSALGCAKYGDYSIADIDLRRMHDRKAVQNALALSRTGRPFESFIAGAEPSRWG